MDAFYTSGYYKYQLWSETPSISTQGFYGNYGPTPSPVNNTGVVNLSQLSAGVLPSTITINPAQINPGVLPSGVTVPAAQVTAGTFGVGVQLPASQVSPGALPTGVTIGASQITGVLPASALPPTTNVLSIAASNLVSTVNGIASMLPLTRQTSAFGALMDYWKLNV